ncbi:MAG: pilus assembly protein, partial [Alcaligenaceae bacterium]
VVDQVGLTILEKGWHSGQGLFDDRSLPTNEIAGATPDATSTGVGIKVNGMGFRMRLTTQVPSTGRALRGEYFAKPATNYKNVDGTPTTVVSNDTADHIWNGASPATGVNGEYFSARYTGTFTAPEAGNYYFRTLSDDGVRLYVNDVRRIDNWTDHGTATDTSDAIALTAGQTFTLRVEFYQGNGGAQLQVQWRKPSTTDYSTFTSDAVATDYTMRVKVCDPGVGVEANCKRYGNVGSTNYKPEGLIQQYSDKMRFSAFGYLNDSSLTRDGGVLRARQKFVAPMQPVPGQPAVVNDHREWDATTGIFVNNPDAADAAATNTAFGLTAGTISYSGVMNYLNLFG